MNRNIIGPLILILLGTLLFLEQIDVLDLEFRDYLIYGLTVFGFLLLLNGLGRVDKKGVLGGTFFLTFGIVLIYMQNNYYFRDDQFGFGMLFLCLAFANLLYYLFRIEKYTNLIWSIIFAVVGGGFLLVYYNYYPGWIIADFFSTYWPVVLILLGIAIIMKAFKQKQAVQLEGNS